MSPGEVFRVPIVTRWGRDMPKKSVKLERGTGCQKREGGTFYYRYQMKEKRKAVSLKTKNVAQAKRKAADLQRMSAAHSLSVSVNDIASPRRPVSVAIRPTRFGSTRVVPCNTLC